MKKAVEKRSSEHGGAGVKLVIVMLVLFLIANAGYQFIPVAYAGESLKQDMQTAVIQALAMPSRMTPADTVKQKIQVSFQSNNIGPSNAIIDVKQVNNVLTAHVVYDKEIPIIPFGIYNYHYQFDHTVTPNGFLTKQ